MMILDSCIIIDFLRRHEAALQFVSSLEDKPSLSVVTIMELYAGAKSQKEERAIALIENDSHLLKIDEPIARQAGIYLKHYQASHQIGPADALIAAAAEHHRLQLVTLNLKHFPMFSNLKRPY